MEIAPPSLQLEAASGAPSLEAGAPASIFLSFCFHYDSLLLFMVLGAFSRSFLGSLFRFVLGMTVFLEETQLGVSQGAPAKLEGFVFAAAQ